MGPVMLPVTSKKKLLPTWFWKLVRCPGSGSALIFTSGTMRFLGGAGSRTAKEGAAARKQANAVSERQDFVFMILSLHHRYGFSDLILSGGIKPVKLNLSAARV